MPSPHAPSLPPIQVVTDHPCATCGYNLRTIPLDSRCPECGTAVQVSIEVPVLKAVPRKALRPLHKALWVYVASNAVLGVVLSCVIVDLGALPALVGAPV